MRIFTRLYVYFLMIFIVSWLSIGTAHTDMSGEWIFDKPINPAIEKAMLKQGPNYFYHILYDDTLEVSKDEGESWERLRY